MRSGAGPGLACLLALAAMVPAPSTVMAQTQADWEAAWDAEDERYDGIDEDSEERRTRREPEGAQSEPDDDGFYDDVDPEAGDDSPDEADAADDDPFADSHDSGHGGFFLQLGVGAGYYTATGTEMTGDVTLSGVTFPLELHMGGTVADALVLGAGFNVDFAPSPSIEQGGVDLVPGDVTQFVVGLNAFALYYIDRDMGLSAQARAGWGRIETAASGMVGNNDPMGFVGGLGVGKDFWLGGDLGLGALLRASYGAFALGGTTYGTLSLGLLATVTWY